LIITRCFWAKVGKSEGRKKREIEKREEGLGDWGRRGEWFKLGGWENGKMENEFGGEDFR
jgi:hypothetical protein